MSLGRQGRGVRAAAAIQAFRKLGFSVDRIHGSHYILKHADGRRVTIPRHGEVKPGLLLNQLKRVAIAWEDFREPL
ncbi:MAG: addiction module toxin, HicA family [Dehalococcoidia bacterium]|nr:addiction module toxin, HicA family [Dehalococcoidia bacterium]